MKRFLLILLALLLIAVACIYVLIPSKIVISRSITVQANQQALLRKITDVRTWKEWWPSRQDTNDYPSSFLLNGMRFKPGPAKVLSVPLSIDAQHFTSSTELSFITLGIDSTTVLLETAITVSYNPFKRPGIYSESQKVKKSFSDILRSINSVYSATTGLYGFDIRKGSVTDSILVFTSKETEGYPTVNKIYSLIDELKAYIKKNSAEETGFPMLNVNTPDSIHYLVKVAIPVNKKLPDSGKIRYRWMLGGGNILTTEVRGGPHTIGKAFEQIRHYIADYNRIAPAIPFESLVTDRRSQPDSTKWVTRIFYPVM